MPVQVLFEGKPLTGVKIGTESHGSKQGLHTDKDGKAVLAIERGRQLLIVSHELPYSGPEADKTIFMGTLRFATE